MLSTYLYLTLTEETVSHIKRVPDTHAWFPLVVDCLVPSVRLALLHRPAPQGLRVVVPAQSVQRVSKYRHDRARPRVPDPEQALRQWIAELTIAHKKSGGKDTRYADAAAQHTRKNAARGVAEWMALWGC